MDISMFKQDYNDDKTLNASGLIFGVNRNSLIDSLQEGHFFVFRIFWVHWVQNVCAQLRAIWFSEVIFSKHTGQSTWL